MNQAGRDELLIRLDERTAAIAETTKKQEEHLGEINGQVSKNTSFRKLGTWIASAIFLALITLITALILG